MPWEANLTTESIPIQVPITVIPFIKTGRLKPIAVSGETRLPALPQVPTYTEAGIPNGGLTGISGIIAPAKTPSAAISRIAKEIATILAMPSTQDFMVRQGAETMISTPEQTNAIIKEEVARYARIIKGAGITHQP